MCLHEKTDDKNRDDIDPDKLKYGLQEFPSNEDKKLCIVFSLNMSGRHILIVKSNES